MPVELCGGKYYRVRDVAEELHVPKETVNNWIKSGRLRATAVGRNLGRIIAEADLKKFLSSGMHRRAPGKGNGKGHFTVSGSVNREFYEWVRTIAHHEHVPMTRIVERALRRFRADYERESADYEEQRGA